MKMRQKIPVVLIYFLFGTVPLSSLAGQSNAVQITLTKGTEDNQPGNTPQSKFFCNDTIYAVLNGNWPANTEHKFETYWTNPQGKQQEHSRLSFTAYGSTRVWMWLRLHRGGDNALSRMFGLADDSMQEFVGKWKVDFYIDGKKVSRQNFSVAC